MLKDRVNMLYSRLPTSLLVTFAVAVAFVLLQRSQGAHDGQLIWLGVILSVLTLRALSAWLYQRRHTLIADNHGWLTLFRNSASLTAGVWGAAGVLFFPADDPVLQAMTMVVLVGVAAGAMNTLVADYPTFRNYVILVLSPIVGMALLQGTELQLLLGLMGGVLIVFQLNSGRQNSRSVLEALRLYHENIALITDLRREKDRVLSDAEVMMGTVLSTAPIALWAVDNDGAISFMEGKQLESRTGRVLPRVGDNLLEAFPQHPQIAYETQRALSGESFATEIELDGQTFEVHYNPLRNDDGEQHGAIGVATDISDRIEHKRELSRRANYDELTGLPNRTLIMNQIEHAFDNARRHHKHVALFFLDLDNFKSVNDTMGHNAGDELLRLASQRLNDAVRQNDMPARLGGDEFLVVSEDLVRPEDAEIIAHKVARLFQRPFEIEQRELYVTTSVGIAIFPQDGETADDLLRSADTAMYHAKAAGKNKYRFFTREMQDTADQHLAMETELRHALARQELRLMYQPKYDTESGQIRGAEALLRWHSPTLGEVTPDDFVPVAEFAGLMPHIGDWVLQAACAEAMRWQSLADEPIHVAINVSPQQFRNTDLLANVAQALVGTSLPPGMLELEITESVLVQDAPETMRVFKALNELGITLSLDDFGTGYSSLSYLKRFPMQVLKIDKAFIQDLGSNRDDDSLVEAIIAMAHSMKMQIVAEGVETEQQFDFLKQRRVELVQGYYFSRPLTAEQFRALLKAEADNDDALQTWAG